MAIIQALESIGEQVSFYNIDYFRYSKAEIEDYFCKNQFDVIGISAVVSTAYAYTKFLTNLIKKVSPKSIVVVGGNLAASAEILLRYCPVDICITGDGEMPIKELISHLNAHEYNVDSLKKIKGLVFLDSNGEAYFTGHGEKLQAGQISWPDYSILERDGSIDYFISDQIDKRVDGHQSVNELGGRIATVILAKGCVARCTFCHRWERGYRAKPVEQAIAHIKFLMHKYNVRYLDIADENFGADVVVTNELVEQLGALNLAWRVGGVRANTVTKDMLIHWRKNGCANVEFGTESGSQKMLDIMEKKTTVETNINALRWVGEAGLGTIIQLIIGMPGENDETIKETISFINNVSSDIKFWNVNELEKNQIIDIPEMPSDRISINYAQALPGTPLYEWARENGYIGNDGKGEESYLMKISDVDAYSEDHFINYTGLPTLKVLMWRPWILAEIDAYHYKKTYKDSMKLTEVFGYYSKFIYARVFIKILKNIRDKILSKKEGDYSYIKNSGYFNIYKGLKYSPILLCNTTRPYFFALLAVLVALKQGRGIGEKCKLLLELLMWKISGSKYSESSFKKISLRKQIRIEKQVNFIENVKEGDPLELRVGR
ncbi:radical SAM protein [Polynucleobacter sp. AP-Ainpum-60-G11]|nr:radical SAM protein [Polynucleobacter sp. AP-Ainpum-60-G11]